MVITAGSIVTFCSLTAAVCTTVGTLLGVYRWYLKQQAQDSDIKRLKEEQTLICYSLSACLDGLEQLGANHRVSDAKDKLEKHLNKSAHK